MSINAAIGIPTYNQANSILKAIKSSQGQTYSPLQIIVADDCSTDNTAQAITGFESDSRVFVHRNAINAGRIGNYRKLLYEYAKSAEWYVNLDGDDYLTDNNFLDYAMSLVNRKADEQIVFFQGNHKIGTLKKVFPGAEALDEQSILVDGKDYFLRFDQLRKFSHLATFYKATIARKIGFYNFDCLSADFHSVSRLALQGKVILSGKTVGNWQEHEANQSKGLDEQTMKKELASLNDLALYARKYFGVETVKDWLEKMRQYYYQRLFYQMSKEKVTPNQLWFTLRHFQLNFIYFKCLGRLSLKLVGIPVR